MVPSMHCNITLFYCHHCYGLLLAQIWQTGAIRPSAIIPRYMWARSSFHMCQMWAGSGPTLCCYLGCEDGHELTQLHQIIQSGWPKVEKSVSIDQRLYFPIQDELAFETPLSFRGQRLGVSDITQRENHSRCT